MHQPVEPEMLRVRVLEKMIEELSQIVYEQDIRLRHLEQQGAQAERAMMAAFGEVLDD